MPMGWRNILLVAFAATATGAVVLCTKPEDLAAAKSSPGVVRLLDAGGEWTSPWLAGGDIGPLEQGLEPVFRESFEGRSHALLPHLAAGLGTEGESQQSSAAPAPTISPPTESTSARLTFPEPAGAAVHVLSVTPETPYVVSAEVFTALDQEPPEAAMVGRLAVVELRRHATLDGSGVDHREAIEAALPVAHHLAPSGSDARIDFETTVHTHAVALVLMAGNPGWWNDVHDSSPSGTVQFDQLEVFRIPLQRSLVQELLPGGTEAKPGDFITRGKVHGDQRRCLLAVPGTRWEVPVVLPEGDFRIDVDCAVLPENSPSFGETPLEFSLEIAGTPSQRVTRTLHPQANLDDRLWNPLTLRGTGNGREVQVALEVRADSPCNDVVAFAEPRLMQVSDTRPSAPHVILISLDTLRADHLGCYGYQREDGHAVSPGLDRFAEQSWVFESARAAAPYTLPSHATMMTGLYPQEHGVTERDRHLVAGVHPLLAEQFAAAGYSTAGFTAGGFLSYEYGFDQGFDRYSILDPLLLETDRFREVFPVRGERALNDRAFARSSLDAAKDWLLQHRNSPAFLFLHSYLIHSYHPSPKSAERFAGSGAHALLQAERNVERIDLDCAQRGVAPDAKLVRQLEDLYDATIYDADLQLEAFFEFLDREGFLDNTVVCVTSDHGEEFAEHGGLVHGRTLYEEMQHVPLILRVPGTQPRRISPGVDQIDLAPTLLSAAGLPTPPVMSGESLLNRVRNDQFSSTLWCEVNSVHLAESYALYRGPWKLIHTPVQSEARWNQLAHRPPEWQLFQLPSDPHEQRNLAAIPSDSETAEQLRGELRRFLQRLESNHRRLAAEEDLSKAVSSETEELLRELGYAAE